MLVDEIRTRMKEALKAKRRVEKDILSVCLGEIQAMEAREGSTMSDPDAQKVVRKLLKSIDETLAAGAKEETKVKLQEERQVLESLLPRSLTVDEIVAQLESVKDAIRGAKADGPAMGVAMKQLKASGAAVESKDVSVAVKRLRN